MSHQKKEIGKMEKQLKQWGAKIDDLVAGARDTGVEVKDDYHTYIQNLKAQHQAAQVKLAEMKAVGSEKWETFRISTDKAWSEFESAFRELARSDQKGK